MLKIGRFNEMRNWYSKTLGMEAFFIRGRPDKPSWTQSQQIAFFKLHGIYPYLQMLGIFEVENTMSQANKDPGLHHFQPAHGNFEELFMRYDRLKTQGIIPIQTWNHGVMTSFNYEDPDGNQAEMTCVNFAKENDFSAYFETDEYKNNISGVQIDPGDYINRYRSGIPQEELVKISIEK